MRASVSAPSAHPKNVYHPSWASCIAVPRHLACLPAQVAQEDGSDGWRDGGFHEDGGGPSILPSIPIPRVRPRNGTGRIRHVANIDPMDPYGASTKYVPQVL